MFLSLLLFADLFELRGEGNLLFLDFTQDGCIDRGVYAGFEAGNMRFGSLTLFNREFLEAFL